MAGLRYGSLFSGVEAASLAWAPLGWEPAWFAEVEPFCCELLARRFPGVPNLGDVTKIDPAEVVAKHGPVDVVVGGSPCFVAGTTIVTRRGLVNIEDVVVGDEVFTHAGRYMPVTAVGGQASPTCDVKGQGATIRTTPDHPFLAVRHTWRWVHKRAIPPRVREASEPAWIPARELKGLRWASPARFPDEAPPAVERVGNERLGAPFSAEFFWFVGAWLGDGWAKWNARRGTVTVCARKGAQTDELLARARAAGFDARSCEMPTVSRVLVYDKALARWLHREFGKGAEGKTMPTWAFGMRREWREALFAGYAFADGCRARNASLVPNVTRFTTVSKRLAVGVRLLAHTLGLGVGTTRSHPRGGSVVIEGRRCNERPFYQVTAYDSSRSSVEAGGFRWGLVRDVRDTGQREMVYNLSVAEDESYVADGIAVHNCQSFSIAGARAGLDDPRGVLAFEFLRVVGGVRPRWVVFENVPGLLSSGDGRDFGAFLGALAKLGFGLAWRILDAQYAGVPQRRRRVFVVGHLGDWRRAAAVLFERESLSGDPPARRAAGEGVAGPLGAGAQGSGWRDDADRAGAFVPVGADADDVAGDHDGDR